MNVSVKFIIKSGHWRRWRCCLKDFFYSKLWRQFSAERKHFSSFSGRSCKKHFCKIVLKSATGIGGDAFSFFFYF